MSKSTHCCCLRLPLGWAASRHVTCPGQSICLGKNPHPFSAGLQRGSCRSRFLLTFQINIQTDWVARERETSKEGKNDNNTTTTTTLICDAGDECNGQSSFIGLELDSSYVCSYVLPIHSVIHLCACDGRHDCVNAALGC